jgi:hypothetical protein
MPNQTHEVPLALRNQIDLRMNRDWNAAQPDGCCQHSCPPIGEILLDIVRSLAFDPFE